MRPSEELQAELVRTRRKLYRLTGVMTFVFIACLIVVFAAVGGALIVVDKRAARTLPAEANDTHQTASAPSAPAPIGPPPVRAEAAPPNAVATATANNPNSPPTQPISQPAPPQVPANAAPPATVAAAPANPPPQPPQPAQVRAPATTAAVSPADKPANKPMSPTPPAAGLAAARTAQPAATAPPATTAQPAALPPLTDIKHTARAHPRHDERSTVGAAPGDTAAHSDEPPQAPAPSTDLKHTANHTARTHSRHDERSTVGAAPSDPPARFDDAGERRRTRAIADADDDMANGPRSQRVIVVRPTPRDEARTHDDDQGPPPRQHDFFGDLFGGIFGGHDQ